MDNPETISITAEQIAALQAGQGIVRIQDPGTQRIYLLIDQGLQPSLSDDYFRAKINEGLAESQKGESLPWDPEQLKQELRERIGEQQSETE